MNFRMPDLLPHQIPVMDYIVQTPSCGIFLNIGGGKTVTTLSALARIRPSGHILVIAPIAIARSVWINEIEKFGFPLRTRSLLVNDNDKPLTRKKRLERYEEILTAPPTMYFINTELIHDLVEWMPIEKDADGNRYRVWPFPTVIVEESQGFKNPTSRRFLSLASVRPAVVRMIELTGSPTPQGLLDLWSQVYLLDGGLALGEKFTDYRAKYFEPKKRRDGSVQMVNGRPVSWTLLPGAEEAIHARVKHLVLSATNTSVHIPRNPDQIVEVVLPKHVLQTYRAFRRDLVIELASFDPNRPGKFYITAENAAILRGKLLQFASGTLYTGDDHTKDVSVIHNEKLALLEHIVANNGGNPVLVAYRYKCDQPRIIEHLTKAGFRTEFFDGSRDMVRRWNDRQIPVMLLQPASTSHGINLQEGGSDLVWYSLPDSLEQYQQTIGRLHRIGQQEPVQVYKLLTRDTLDDAQPGLLSRKEITQDALLEAVRVEISDILDELEFEDVEDIIGSLDLSPL